MEELPDMSLIFHLTPTSYTAEYFVAHMAHPLGACELMIFSSDIWIGDFGLVSDLFCL